MNLNVGDKYIVKFVKIRFVSQEGRPAAGLFGEFEPVEHFDGSQIGRSKWLNKNILAINFYAKLIFINHPDVTCFDFKPQHLCCVCESEEGFGFLDWWRKNIRLYSNDSNLSYLSFIVFITFACYYEGTLRSYSMCSKTSST